MRCEACAVGWGPSAVAAAEADAIAAACTAEAAAAGYSRAAACWTSAGFLACPVAGSTVSWRPSDTVAAVRSPSAADSSS